MNEIIFHVENAPEGGYAAKALKHSIFTEGDTWIELKASVKDAVACHFDMGAIETEMAKFLEAIALDANFDEFDFVANKSECAESENEMVIPPTKSTKQK
jgi:hypothetical protein